jgi:hypothetical protein
MLKLVLVATTLWSAVDGSQYPAVASSQWSVASSQYPVVSNQGEISTLYSPLSTLEKDSTLADVTISAPKYPEKLARTGKVVSVISAEMIQANQGKVWVSQ